MRSGSRSSRSVTTGSATRSGGGEDDDVLLLIGGLPGVGKTTVAREVARRSGGAHVRIDALEAGLVDLGLAPPGRVGAAGYGLALTVADTLLVGGATVIVDAVFPVAESRAPWTALAAQHGVRSTWVRLVCGNAAEHRWAEPHTVVDTAAGDPVAAVGYALGSTSA